MLNPLTQCTDMPKPTDTLTIDGETVTYAEFCKIVDEERKNVYLELLRQKFVEIDTEIAFEKLKAKIATEMSNPNPPLSNN